MRKTRPARPNWLDAWLRARGLQRPASMSRTSHITNAVKHFKFEERASAAFTRGRTLREINACRSLAEVEIGAVHSEILVALARRRRHRSFGKGVSVARSWKLLPSPFPQVTHVTVTTTHPAAILRA